MIQTVFIWLVSMAFADAKVNVSGTPPAPDMKAKLNIATIWVDAMNNEAQPVTIENINQSGEVIEERLVAKPIVTCYAGETANGDGD